MRFKINNYDEPILKALRRIQEADSAKERVARRIKHISGLMFIRNAKDTGGDTVPWGDWSDYWETVVADTFPKTGLCVRCGGRKELEGAHVWIGSDDQNYYIVPMCHECNTKDHKVFFPKVAYVMAWVDYKVCGKGDAHKAYDKQRGQNI